MTINNKNFSEYDSAIIIFGPGMEDARAISQFILQRISNVMIIGDGINGIKEEYYNSISKLLYYSQFTSRYSKTLVIVDTHGRTNDNGKHYIVFGEEDDFNYYSADLFKDLGSIFFDKAIDVLYLPCHAGGALNDAVNFLPNGSKVLFSVEDDEIASFIEVFDLINFYNKYNAPLTLETLYQYYLLTMISLDSMPFFVKIGNVNEEENLNDIESQESELFDDDLEPEEINEAKGKILSLFKDDKPCLEQAEFIMNNLVEEGEVIIELSELYDNIFDAWELLKDHFNINNTYNLCDSNLPYFKAQMDDLLLANGIPLVINLDKLAQNFITEGGEGEIQQLWDYFAYKYLEINYCDQLSTAEYNDEHLLSRLAHQPMALLCYLCNI